MIKTLIVGCGGIANQHAEGCRLAPSAELYGVCDLDSNRAAAFAEKHGTRAFSSFDEILKNKEIDLIIISTPDETHCNIAVKSMNSGKHVLIEKPFAMSMDEADMIIDTAEKTGMKAMCGQSLRFRNKFLKVKELVSSGRVGDVKFIRLSSPSSPFWNKNTWKNDPSRNKNWLLIHNGMHNLDYLCWLLDSTPERVHMTSHKGQEWIDINEYVSVTIRFKNGAVAISEENRIMPQGYPFHLDFYILGTGGMMDLSDKSAYNMSVYNNGAMSYPGAFINDNNYEHPFAGEIEELCQAIINDREPLIPLKFSKEVLKSILEASITKG